MQIKGKKKSRNKYLNLKKICVFVFATFMGYIVIGGISTGQSTLILSTMNLSILILDILFFAVIEGLEVAITTTDFHNLDLMKNKYPHAHRLHKELHKGTTRIHQFLAGKEILVIVLLFLAAGLTTFPNMTKLPYVNLDIPNWFEIPFMKLGLAGAFFFSWLGQLAPKLIARTNPLAFMNMPFMNELCGIILAIDGIGLSLPSSILAKYFQKNRVDLDQITNKVTKQYQKNKESKGDLAKNKPIFILKIRLAKGQISIEEYRELRNTVLDINA